VANVPLGTSAYVRKYSGAPDVRLENRYLESSPSNLKEGRALLSRPGSVQLGYFPPGPHRLAWSRPGAFGSALFIFSGNALWRLDANGTKTQITGGVISGTNAPSVCSVKGAGYERLFFADGLLLQYYDGVTATMHGVAMPGGVAATSVVDCASFVLVSQALSRRFYYLQPGAVTINALDFAEKESGPDNIVDMLRVNDQVMLLGEGTTETWYATGATDPAAPQFKPVQGRAFSRGVVQGTAVVVKDTAMLVGDDGVVYELGSGLTRVSHHGIEESIRRQVRREEGVVP
jgi:hypothetical protein